MRNENKKGRPISELAEMHQQTESPRDAALKARRESKERFRTLVENLPLGVYRNTPGPQGEFLMANPAFLSMFGFDSKESLKETSVADLYADPRERKAFSDRLLAQGRVSGLELCFKKKDGSLFWGSVTSTVVRDESGSVAYFDGITEDISERKQAQNLIRAQHDLALKLGAAVGLDETLRLCVKAAIHSTEMDAGGVYLVDETSGDLNMVFSTGLSLEFIESVSHHDADSPNAHLVMAGKPIYVNYKELSVPMDDVRRNEGLHAIAVLPVHHEGRVIACLNITSRSLGEIPATTRHALETIAAQIGSSVARAQAEEALRASEERLNLALEATTDGLFDWNMQTDKAHFNPRYYTMLGYEPYEVPASYDTWIDWLHPDDKERALNTINEYTEGKRDSHEIEFRLRTKSGGWRWILSRGKTIRDSNGRPARMVGTHVDLTERVWMEKELREKQAREALILHSLPMAFYVAQPYGNLGGTWVTEQIDRISGFSAKQFLADTHLWASRLHPDDRARALETFEKIIAEESIQVRYRWQAADGRYLWFLDQAVLVRDENSEPKEIIGMWLDITEQVQAETQRDATLEALRESQAQLQAILDHSPALISIKDLKGNVVLVNRNFEVLEGPSPEEFMGKNVYDLFPHDVADTLWKNDLAALEAGQPVQTEEVVAHKDGTWHTYLTVKFPLYGKADQAFGICAISTDITERKQADEALRESEHFNKAVISSVGEGIIVYDCQFRYQVWNHFMESLTGLPASQVLGKNALDVFPHLREQGIDLLLKQALSGETVYSPDTPFHIPSTGRTGWVKGLYSPHVSATGEIIGVVGTVRDITEQVRAERKIRQLNQELERRVLERTAELQAANKELEAFAYSVSHDLRAPLRRIQGFSQALAEDYADRLDTEGQDYLQRVHGGSQRMTQLIDDMLALSRVTRRKLERAQVDLSALAQAVTAELGQTQPEREVEFVVAEGVIAKGDVGLLRIVLENLLNNAYKFTGKQARARIEFGATQVDGQTAYFVQDDGAGFDMTHAGKLFDPFQRLHAASEFKGTGIGLATVQRIVHRHGGRCWATGDVGKGATFYFAL